MPIHERVLDRVRRNNGSVRDGKRAGLHERRGARLRDAQLVRIQAVGEAAELQHRIPPRGERFGDHLAVRPLHGEKRGRGGCRIDRRMPFDRSSGRDDPRRSLFSIGGENEEGKECRSRGYENRE